MKKITVLLLVAVSLASCKFNEVITLKSNSADNNVKVTFNAKKAIPGDPWKCELKVKAFSFEEGSLQFEIYSDELNDQNVKFDWVEPHNCNISISQSDGEVRKFQLKSNSNGVTMAEV